MIKYSTLTIAILLLTGCATTYSPYTSTRSVPIRVAPASEQPKLIFPDQIPPLRPYFLVADLHIWNQGALSSGALTPKLRQEAMKMGAGAVIVDAKNEFTYQTITALDMLSILSDALSPATALGGPYTTTKTMSGLSGFGIKYLDSLDLHLLDNSPKSVSFFQINKTDTTIRELLLQGELNNDFQLAGYQTFSDQALRLFEAKSMRFDLDFLLKSTNLWYFRIPENPALTRRKYLRLEDWPLYQVRYQVYNEATTGPWYKLKVTYNPNGNEIGRETAVVKPVFDPQKTLIQKKISVQGTWVAIEKLTYDEQGRIASRRLYEGSQVMGWIPTFETTYTYHSTADIPLIFNDSLKIYNRHLLPQDWPLLSREQVRQ